MEEKRLNKLFGQTDLMNMEVINDRIFFIFPSSMSTGPVWVPAQAGTQGGREELPRVGKYLHQQGLSPSACKHLLTRADTADAQMFSPTRSITHTLAAPGAV